MSSIRSTLVGLLGAAAAFCSAPLALASDAASDDATSSTATPSVALDAEASDDDANAQRKSVGLMLDLGSMHGAMLSLLYRPLPWLRLHAGAGTNAVSPGYRAGVTLAKPGGGPSLNIEGGHFLPGDMNGLLKVLVGTSYEPNSRIEHFDYDFINLHAGWEVESGNLIFFARGGVSVLWTRIPALVQADSLRAGAVEGSSTTSGTEPFDLVLPSIAIGFVGLL